jgi:RNA polymerase sigma-70 factor (ECF subfamily)
MNFLDSFEESEDVVQEVFTRFWERSREVAFSGSARAYLFSAVRNNCVKLVKDKIKYPTEPVETVEELFAYTEEHFDRERELLSRALERLPGRGREVFTLIVLEDLKYREVAERLGISVNTVKTCFARALKQLRHSLGIILLVLLACVRRPVK